MIVTSVRCYLNILTQIMTKEELLNAQYYICDTVDKSKSITTEDLIYDSEAGTYSYRQGVTDITTTKSEYLLEYTESRVSMNIQSCLTLFVTDIDKISNSKNPIDRFNAQIYTDEFIMGFYNVFISKIKSDKLVIMLFYDEQSVCTIGHDVCEYLSKYFGQDVTFIDPQYRPNVRGRVSYIGDKNAAEINIRRIREKSAILGFINAISQSDFNACANNVASFLSVYDTFEELIWLHDLIWPDDRLPPDHYTIKDLKEIIVSKAIDESANVTQMFARSNNMRQIEHNYNFNR